MFFLKRKHQKGLFFVGVGGAFMFFSQFSSSVFFPATEKKKHAIYFFFHPFLLFKEWFGSRVVNTLKNE